MEYNITKELHERERGLWTHFSKTNNFTNFRLPGTVQNLCQTSSVFSGKSKGHCDFVGDEPLFVELNDFRSMPSDERKDPNFVVSEQRKKEVPQLSCIPQHFQFPVVPLESSGVQKYLPRFSFSTFNTKPRFEMPSKDNQKVFCIPATSNFGLYGFEETNRAAVNAHISYNNIYSTMTPVELLYNFTAFQNPYLYSTPQVKSNLNPEAEPFCPRQSSASSLKNMVPTSPCRMNNDSSVIGYVSPIQVAANAREVKSPLECCQDTFPCLPSHSSAVTPALSLSPEVTPALNLSPEVTPALNLNPEVSPALNLSIVKLSYADIVKSKIPDTSIQVQELKTNSTCDSPSTTSLVMPAVMTEVHPRKLPSYLQLDVDEIYDHEKLCNRQKKQNSKKWRKLSKVQCPVTKTSEVVGEKRHDIPMAVSTNYNKGGALQTSDLHQDPQSSVDVIMVSEDVPDCSESTEKKNPLTGINNIYIKGFVCSISEGDSDEAEDSDDSDDTYDDILEQFSSCCLVDTADIFAKSVARWEEAMANVEVDETRKTKVHFGDEPRVEIIYYESEDSEEDSN